MSQRTTYFPIHIDSVTTPTKASISAQLQRVLTNPEFHATDMQKKFLKFIVSETLAGNSHEIKGYTVATRVFGRRADFDQNNDPIVSIHANKLRRALERYYLIAGQSDPLRFDIPKGTYVPVFLQQGSAKSDRKFQKNETAEIRFDDSWPTLVVLPFQDLTGDPDLKYLSIGLTVELGTELARYQDLRVLISNPGVKEKKPSEIGARFAVEGTVRKDTSGIKIAVQLVDLSKQMVIWADAYSSGFDSDRMIHFQEQVARIIVVKIGCEFGIITKAVARESKNKPAPELKTYEAILRHHEYRMTFAPDAFMRAFDALRFATARDPQNGHAWALLACLYCHNYTLEFFDLDTPLEESLVFIQNAIRLEPENRRVRIISALIRLINNKLETGIAEVEKAIALNPNSLLNMENCGYFLTLMGEWQRGSAIINEVIRLNPYYDPVARHALWVNSIRQGEYQQAYQETLCFRMPMLFWEPLMKAATFGLTDRTEEGKQSVENLLALKPDFKARGRILIRHYIKFDDIIEQMIIGLEKCGLSI
jgi:adenylate cyclase